MHSRGSYRFLCSGIQIVIFASAPDVPCAYIGINTRTPTALSDNCLKYPKSLSLAESIFRAREIRSSFLIRKNNIVTVHNQIFFLRSFAIISELPFYHILPHSASRIGFLFSRLAPFLIFLCHANLRACVAMYFA